MVIHPDGTSSVEWHTAGYKTPDDDVWEQASTSAELAFAVNKQRAISYPPITDYLDGVVKGDQAQIDAYIAACQAVKAKYPKPE